MTDAYLLTLGKGVPERQELCLIYLCIKDCLQFKPVDPVAAAARTPALKSLAYLGLALDAGIKKW